jgi:hypothetical protein
MSHPDQWQEVTIPIREIVSRLGWWLLGVALSVFGPAIWVSGLPEWSPRSWSAGTLHEVAVGVALLLAAYLLSVPVHEGLHALGMLLTGARRSDIRFGARILQGVVYVHCSAPMKLSAYRIVLVLPVIVTGFLPAVWGIVSGKGWVMIYAYLMIVSSIGDLEMLWRLRGRPGSLLVRDHPSLLGCEIRFDASAGGPADA